MAVIICPVTGINPRHLRGILPVVPRSSRRPRSGLRSTPATRAEAAEKTEQGKFHITFDKSLLGQVNGGGSEISFNTFTGDIYIRKKK